MSKKIQFKFCIKIRNCQLRALYDETKLCIQVNMYRISLGNHIQPKMSQTQLTVALVTRKYIHIILEWYKNKIKCRCLCQNYWIRKLFTHELLLFHSSFAVVVKREKDVVQTLSNKWKFDSSALLLFKSNHLTVISH